VEQPLDSLIYRKKGADREDAQGSDERPEIGRASVVEWMLYVS
jgi:hypothetical protein